MRPCLLAVAVAGIAFGIGTGVVAQPEIGIVQVYGTLDEAAGFVGCADDLAEAAQAGATRVAHFPPDRARYAGLADWLSAHPEDAALQEAARQVFPDQEDLAFQLFFWKTYLRDAGRAPGGALKVLVGPLWPTFVDAKSGVRAEQVERFIAALGEFEKSQAPERVAGWVLTEEPLAERNRHDPAHAKPLVDAIRAGETRAALPPRPVWVWESMARPPKQVGAFLAVADDLLLIRDGWLWNTDPPARVEDPAWGTIPVSLRTAREIARLVKNEKLRVHVSIQAFDWADDDILQPSHLDMHQQLRLALSGGLADRGAYLGKPAWVDPPAGVWLYAWSDCKSERKTDPVHQRNRWDAADGPEWAEALRAERNGEGGAIHVTRDETWFGSLTLIGDVIVHKGATLTIRPGTMVRVAAIDQYQGGKDKKHVEIVVFGTLVIKGNEQMKVTFRCDTESPALNAKPRKPAKGDWYGFRVEKGGAVDRNKHTYVSEALKD